MIPESTDKRLSVQASGRCPSPGILWRSAFPASVPHSFAGDPPIGSPPAPSDPWRKPRDAHPENAWGRGPSGGRPRVPRGGVEDGPRRDPPSKFRERAIRRGGESPRAAPANHQPPTTNATKKDGAAVLFCCYASERASFIMSVNLVSRSSGVVIFVVSPKMISEMVQMASAFFPAMLALV